MGKKKGKKSGDDQAKVPPSAPEQGDPPPSDPQPSSSQEVQKKGKKGGGGEREATPEVVHEPKKPQEKGKKKEKSPAVVQEPEGPPVKGKKHEKTPPAIQEPEGPPVKGKKHEKTPPAIQEPEGPPKKGKRQDKSARAGQEPEGPSRQTKGEAEVMVGLAGDSSHGPPPGFGRGVHYSGAPPGIARGRGPPPGIARDNGPPPGTARDSRPPPGIGRGASGSDQGASFQAPQARTQELPVTQQRPAWGPRAAPVQQAPGPRQAVAPAQGSLPQQQAQAKAPRPQQAPAPARQASLPGLVKDMSKMCLAIPARRDKNKGGTWGRPTVIETNHLSLNLSKLRNPIAVHYDVHLDPDKPKRLLRPAMFEFHRKHYPNRFAGFDGRKNLFSSGRLPFGDEIQDEIVVKDAESQKDMTFRVRVKLASMVDMTSLQQYMKAGSALNAPQEAIQVIDVILREVASRSFLQVGRSFFTPPKGRVVDLGDGHELWYGFYQSAILGWKPYVNIDVAHKGFPKAQPVIDLICELGRMRYEDLGREELRLSTKQLVSGNLKGLKIEYEIPGKGNSKRCYRVNGLAPCAAKNRFKLEDGREITVAEYFQKQKGYPLRFPLMPCLHVGSQTRTNPIYVPAELCNIIGGQVVMKKMTEIQTSNMIKEAATSTDVRKKKILDALQKVGFNESNVLKEFGLSIGGSFEQVKARVLNPPQLEYSNSKCVQPRAGVWHASPFLEGQNLTNWAILNLGARSKDNEIYRFIDQIKTVGKSLGMVIGDPKLIKKMRYDPRGHDIETFLNDCKKNVAQLVVVVVPDFGDAYSKVKKMAELKLGVLTQCIKDKTMLMRMNPATVSNILLKVNSKLNGVNHTLPSASRPPSLRRPVMIVGADVTHPSPDQTNIPSVAAVCASHEPKAFKYNIQYRLQPPRMEIIQDLEAIMREQLMFFMKINRGQKPERIIFYRDGVSEGQFLQVMNTELMAIRRACSGLAGDYKPPITFLVVQKRHHTRFFPMKREDMDGRNNNVPAGTIVDTDITHPTELDFYLVSHASIQGVSRPTKYCRLWDDSDMNEDELENLTYYLCHLFSRCTRSVSYPAPTYYAHLMAYRARVYLEGEEIQLGSLEREQQMRAIKEAIQVGSPMFFV